MWVVLASPPRYASELKNRRKRKMTREKLKVSLICSFFSFLFFFFFLFRFIFLFLVFFFLNDFFSRDFLFVVSFSCSRASQVARSWWAVVVCRRQLIRPERCGRKVSFDALDMNGDYAFVILWMWDFFLILLFFFLLSFFFCTYFTLCVLFSTVSASIEEAGHCRATGKWRRGRWRRLDWYVPRLKLIEWSNRKQEVSSHVLVCLDVIMEWVWVEYYFSSSLVL
jgi:hypothetical protein